MSAPVFGDSCPEVDADEQSTRYQQCKLCSGPLMPYLVVVMPLPLDEDVDEMRTRANGRMFWSKVSWTIYERGLCTRSDAYELYCLDWLSEEEIRFALNAMSDRSIAQLTNTNTLPMPHELHEILETWKHATGRLYQPPKLPVIVQRQQRRPKKRKSLCIIQ